MAWFTSHLVEPFCRLFHGRLPASEGDVHPTRGLVLVAGGVGGLDLCGTSLRYVLGIERLPYTVELFPWSHGWGRWFADLTDVDNQDHQAKRAAEVIRRFRAAHPEEPVFLVAKSGGSGIVVKALEQLEAESVERVVLLAPALSPQYDLTTALRAVRREVFVFWSPLDILVLGAGTRLFGTIDRVKTVAAGMVGFLVPPRDDPEGERIRQYAKLRQIRWRPAMASAGYLGGHVGPDHPWFLRKYIVPLLRAGDAGPVPA